jgi:hypothetical protein
VFGTSQKNTSPLADANRQQRKTEPQRKSCTHAGGAGANALVKKLWLANTPSNAL